MPVVSVVEVEVVDVSVPVVELPVVGVTPGAEATAVMFTAQ